MSLRTLVFAGVCAAGCTSAASPPPSPAPTPSRAPAPGGAVVAELFTSQGCSSCPPADRLLAELVAAAGERPLIALAFHVDYWNDLGWADPFSSAAATDRQQDYAHVLGRGAYTPQLVINGRAHVVGSQRGEVEAALAHAAAVPTLGATAAVDDGGLRVTATVPAGARGLLVVYEDGLETQVTAGENRGDHLRDQRVVRALVPLDATGQARVALDPAWRRDAVGAVVLAQGGDQAIVGAQALRW